MADLASKTTAAIIYVRPEASGLVFDVVINRGKENGVKLGDKYIVYGLGPELKDPSSGESLGVLELIRGRGEVIHVQEKMSTLRSIEKRSNPSKRTVRRTAPNTNYTLPNLFPQPEVTEEITTPEETEMPFEGVSTKDKAKLI